MQWGKGNRLFFAGGFLDSGSELTLIPRDPKTSLWSHCQSRRLCRSGDQRGRVCLAVGPVGPRVTQHGLLQVLDCSDGQGHSALVSSLHWFPLPATGVVCHPGWAADSTMSPGPPRRSLQGWTRDPKAASTSSLFSSPQQDLVEELCLLPAGASRSRRAEKVKLEFRQSLRVFKS